MTPSSTITLSTWAGNVNERSSTSRAPIAEGHDHLVETVVERERQHARMTSSSLQLQVGADRRRRGQHVAMGQHHALGIAVEPDV